jgi:cytochrome c biogenesis protein CcdA
MRATLNISGSNRLPQPGRVTIMSRIKTEEQRLERARRNAKLEDAVMAFLFVISFSTVFFIFGMSAAGIN